MQIYNIFIVKFYINYQNKKPALVYLSFIYNGIIFYIRSNRRTRMAFVLAMISWTMACGMLRSSARKTCAISNLLSARVFSAYDCNATANIRALRARHYRDKIFAIIWHASTFTSKQYIYIYFEPHKFDDFPSASIEEGALRKAPALLPTPALLASSTLTIKISSKSNIMFNCI